MPDGEIFAKAVSEDRVIMTFDLDFAEIVALCGGQKTNGILFRLHNTRTAHLIDRLATVLADSTDALEKGAVVVVEEGQQVPTPQARQRSLCSPQTEDHALRRLALPESGLPAWKSRMR